MSPHPAPPMCVANPARLRPSAAVPTFHHSHVLPAAVRFPGLQGRALQAQLHTFSYGAQPVHQLRADTDGKGHLESREPDSPFWG